MFCKCMEGKIIIFAAPSGSGKSTIINQVMSDEEEELNLHFSISATSRPPRGKEKNGVEYFFLSPEEFEQKIAQGAFVEYEEVYPGRYYGTLKSQVDKQLAAGENVVFDVDVNGAMRIKEMYKDRALCIFIQPPSLDVLRERLESRGTEDAAAIEQRLSRAQYEIEQSERFDEVVVNDVLDVAVLETLVLIHEFLGVDLESLD